ncbi:MAG: hypothetical protein GWO20_10615 [Candidatus Korarchaeota archaeon]|nr:hypothetical protein [Candidatus Korarchaeota archaeon]NIU83935.1 hypothetical protein [Candidatus Thorarchaeota archaeon]NIW14063.1 hypothetical protein [Candidatus Thorarchaeota archaeon]NIW52173.1 hypothetical protein [Candidatus Korarchaeota archaeon]
METLEEVHANLYVYTAQSVIDREKTEVGREFSSPMTALEFYRQVVPLIAKFKDGHTSIRPGQFCSAGEEENWLFFPFDLSFKGKRVHITNNYSSIKIAEGAELLSINEIPIRKIQERLFKFISGKRREGKEANLEAIFQELLTCVYGFEGEYEVEVRSRGGRVKEKITGVPYEKIREERGLESPPYSYRALLEERIGIINCRSFRDLESFKGVLKETFTKIKGERVEDLIIDIRKNSGGDSRLGNELLGYLTSKPFIRQSKNELMMRSLEADGGYNY